MARTDIDPVWTRSFPIAKEPRSIGEHLRKKRFSTGLRQSEAAEHLGVSCLTLSLWERDRVYPTWPYQPRLITYLGYDPFTDPSLGRPKGNETPFVAFFHSSLNTRLARELRERRIAMRKTRTQCAKEIGISYKTLVSLEMNRRQPTEATRQRIEAFFKMKRVQVRT